MQGLAHYAEHSPSPSPPPSAEAGPSRQRDNPAASSNSNGSKNAHSSLKRTIPSDTTSHSTTGLIAVSPVKASQIHHKRRKVKRNLSSKDDPEHLSENLTHTRQGDLPTSELSNDPVGISESNAEEGLIPGFGGLSEEEVLKRVTRPPSIPGTVDWGIPPPVDPELASDALKLKVSNFLRLKYERDQHINTTLLSSSAFANPHIYSKLVDFVSIDETATAFPSGGWLTRRNIESEIPLYGPAALNATQSAKQKALEKSQEVGKRSTIGFTKGKHRDHDDRDRDRDKRRERDRYRDRDRDRDRRR